MPETVICHYRVAPGNEEAFERLLAEHWPTLDRLQLVESPGTVVYRGVEEVTNRPIYFEIFHWRDGAVERAHEHPQVMQVWERMDQLCEARGERPNMEFPQVSRVDV